MWMKTSIRHSWLLALASFSFSLAPYGRGFSRRQTALRNSTATSALGQSREHGGGSGLMTHKNKGENKGYRKQ